MDAALDLLRRAYKDAADLIENTPAAEQAFESATELAGSLRAVAEDAAELRARMAARIWKAEEMSLAALAQRIGVSKARAAQLIKTATTQEQR